MINILKRNLKSKPSHSDPPTPGEVISSSAAGALIKPYNGIIRRRCAAPPRSGSEGAPAGCFVFLANFQEAISLGGNK